MKPFITVPSLLLLCGTVLLAGCGSSGASAPATIIDLKGSGDYTSANFSTPPTGWKIKYDYTCKWGGNSLGFNVFVQDTRDPNATTGMAVLESAGKTGQTTHKSGVSDHFTGGQYFLKIASVSEFDTTTCKWHVYVPK